MKTLLFFFALIISQNVFAVEIKAEQKNLTTKNPSPVVKQRSNFHDSVWLYEISASLSQDLDQDSYYQNLLLTFDLDTDVSKKEVFLRLTLTSQTGELYEVYTSNSFILYSDDVQDKQSIEIQFTENLPPNDYDLGIEIYDPYTQQLINKIQPWQDDQLDILSLESSNYDQDGEVRIYSVDLSLTHDRDRDGFYEGFEINFDADTTARQQRLIAEFYIDDYLVYTSSPFTIYSDSSADKQYFDIYLNNGFYPDLYNVDVVLLDADYGYQVHYLDYSAWVSLEDVALESSDYINEPNSHTSVEVTHHSGSLSWLILLLTLTSAIKVTISHFKRADKKVKLD